MECAVVGTLLESTGLSFIMLKIWTRVVSLCVVYVVCDATSPPYRTPHLPPPPFRSSIKKQDLPYFRTILQA